MGTDKAFLVRPRQVRVSPGGGRRESTTTRSKPRPVAGMLLGLYKSRNTFAAILAWGMSQGHPALRNKYDTASPLFMNVSESRQQEC